ncbi:MAG: D-alanine--D-alanine ligase family protein [Candidatus Kerfeldbacteria bacterium]|jgi:D-alanine-D-alanine ligase
MSKKIKVAVISGGTSSERSVSIKSAKQVYDNLPEDKYISILINITKDGRWLYNNKKPLKLYDSKTGYKKSELKKFDVAFIALHGQFGEDGKIQALLDIIGLPYTGSGVLASALAMDKIKTSELVKLSGVAVPKQLVIEKSFKDVKSLKNVLTYPCFVKPNKSGSSLGISRVESLKELPKALKLAFKEDNTVLVEEFIDGREITCGVLGNSEKGKIVILPPVEIVPKNKFFDFKAKYDDDWVDEICPAKITSGQTKKVQELSKQIHLLIGGDGLTRTDFILKDNVYYFLEINTIPGITEESICPKEAKAIGLSFGEFLSQQIKLAMNK